MSIEHLNNLRTRTIFVENDTTISLDSLLITPNTLTVFVDKVKLSPSDYDFNATLNTLRLNNISNKNVLISYRIIPVKINDQYYHKDKNMIIAKDSLFLNPFYYQPKQVEQISFLDFGGLQYSGNFARGVQFGSNQDLSLNSNLDLRLSGTIANDIEILAALSDQNIPLQPDGTTQQIQDFDKIFIQITKQPHQIIAGDFSINAFNNYFLKFNKQLQGASYNAHFNFKNQMSLKTATAFAIARGKFARNIFLGQEGNQGPYRLVGNNNEAFIVILAGSEKVFVDGNELTRGETNDYIMDYNSGELTFMPRFLITKDSRIVVEFQYTDQNYFRSTITNSVEFNIKNIQVYTQLYAEQDAKNRPILNDLNDSAKIYLSTIGNNINDAYINSIREVSYDPTRVQYKKIDTTVNGIFYDSVFVYDTNPDSAIYFLNFSFVGTNKGNYVAVQNANNIRVYKWVAPINNIPQGNYNPVILLITPKAQQVFTVGTRYKHKNMQVQAEVAVSNNDVNLFSDIGKKQNKGYGLFLNVNRNDTLKENNNLQTKVSYEYKQHNFASVQPYRSVEFGRDWNTNLNNNNTINLDEHIAHFEELYQFLPHQLQTGIKFSTYVRPNNYTGFEYNIPLSYNHYNLQITSNVRHLTFNDTLNKGYFFRPNMDIKYAIEKAKGLTVGFNYLQENSLLKNKSTDTIINNSFRFNIIGASLQLPDSNKWSFIINYKYRNDFNGYDNIMKAQSVAHLLSINGQANQLKNQNLAWNFTYRDLQVKDSVLAKTPSENTYLGRIEYGNRFFKGTIRSNFIYELGGGQERVKQFTYIEVQAGQGFFTWIDENGNGIKELNEFVPSEFQDSANYVKLYTDLNQYIRTYTTSYTQAISFIPKAVWFNQKGIKNVLSKFQVQSYLQINRKSLKIKGVQPFNPFIFKANDSTVVGLNYNIRNGLIYNSGNPIYSISYQHQLLQDKVLLLNGFDTRKRNEHSFESYYNIKQSYTINLNYLFGKQSYFSEFFPANNFDLRTQNIAPKFSYNYKTMIRTSLGYKLINKKNKANLGNEKMLANKLTTEFRYTKAGKNTLNTSFSFVLVNYNGENGTTKSYTILEGLQNGKNYLWNFEFIRMLGSNLELSLAYEGRKTGTAKVVNTGRAQLRAIF